MKIINFIVDKKRFEDIKGNELWKIMEERKVLEGRSWQSMKERFIKGIREKINTYGLSEEIVKGLRGQRKKKKEKRRT